MDTATYPDGRIIVALSGTDANVYVTEETSPGGEWTGKMMAGGPVPFPGNIAVKVAVRGGVPDDPEHSGVPFLLVQSADPVASGEGDVYASLRQHDGTWPTWAKVT